MLNKRIKNIVFDLILPTFGVILAHAIKSVDKFIGRHGDFDKSIIFEVWKSEKCLGTIYETLAGMILPEGVLEIFEVTDVEEEHTGRHDFRGVEIVVIHIYLDERELRGGESEGLEPNGFTEPRLINDFPIRDHILTLCRRWKTA